MKIQVLVATMNQGDYSLLEKMNIKTDAIVANQCSENRFEDFVWNGNQIRWLSFNEKGVGLNRNNALMRATGDICLFADDDMVYLDNAVETIHKAFQMLPDADAIIFNLYEPIITRYVIPKIMKVHYLNYLRYGTARIVVRLKSVKENGIYFNQCFGGGTEHCHGEDNLFLTDCLKKGLKVYAVPDYIASLTEERESTWKTISTEKYLQDQGILFRQISKKYWRLLCIQDAIRRKGEYKMKWTNAYKIMKWGGGTTTSK